MSFSNPLGQAVLTLTDWLVRPVRRVFRPTGRWDWATLLVAYLVLLLRYLLLYLLLGEFSFMGIALLQAFFALIANMLWLGIAFLLIMVVLSWLMPGHWLHTLVAQLADPMLEPVRRVLPRTSQIDFSPMLLMVLFYVSMIVLRHVERQIVISMIGPGLYIY